MTEEQLTNNFNNITKQILEHIRQYESSGEYFVRLIRTAYMEAQKEVL